MKKMKKIMILLVLGMFVLVFAACGSSKSGTDTGADTGAKVSAQPEAEAPAATENETSADAETETSDLASGEKISVKEFVESDAIQSQVDTVKESMPEGWNVEFLAEGDALVYVYTSPDQFEGAQIDALKKSLDAQFTDEYTGSLCDPVINVMKQLTTAQNPTVVIRYANPDGSVVWEKTYDPE